MPSVLYQNIAIIVAGGAGTRFGETTPKQFLPLGDHPLLLQTLLPFQASPLIDAFCVVVPADYVETVAGWQNTKSLHKMQWVVAGGPKRQDSTAAGFQQIPRCDVVLIHDGARPLVSTALIERLVAAAQQKGAAVPGLKVHETLKKVASGGHILTTVDRNEYATIQTPQGFRYPILQEALQEAQADAFYGTDEAMLVERMGFPVTMVPGSRDNIKITQPEDMKFAEKILQLTGAR